MIGVASVGSGGINGVYVVVDGDGGGVCWRGGEGNGGGCRD